jgi:hypothetical protein
MDVFKTLLLDTPNSLNSLTGTLQISNGGTGATSAAGARDNLLPDYTGNVGKVLTVNSGATDVEWTTNGVGDVVGPASSTDNAIVRYDSTTGKLVQNSGVTISDANLLTTTDLTVNDDTTLGSSNSDTVDFKARVASDINPATDNTYDLGVTGHEWRNLNIDGTANIDSLVADTADVNGGTIDGTTIGAGTPSTGAFTTLTSSSTTTLNGTTIPASKTLVVTTDNATTTATGVVELATTAEMLAGTSTTLVPSVSAAEARSLLGDTTRTVAPVLVADGATSLRRAEATPGAPGAVAGMTITIPFDIQVPAANPSVTANIANIGPGNPSTTNELALIVATTGALQIRQWLDASNHRSSFWSGFLTAHAGQRVRGAVVVFGDSTTAPVWYINGVDVSVNFSAASAGTPPNWMPTTLNTTKVNFGFNYPTGIFVPRAPILGALTAAEVLAWTQTGRLPDWCELGTGSAVASYTSDFSAGVDSWTAFQCTATGNVDGIDGVDDVIRIEGTSGGTSAQLLRNGLHSAGQRVRVRFSYYIPAANSVNANFKVIFSNDVASSVINPTYSIRGTWTTVEVDTPNGITPSSVGRVAFAASSSGGATGNFWEIGDYVYLKNIEIRLLGPIANWAIQPGSVTCSDSGSNRIPLLLTPGITALGDKPETVSVLSNPMTADGFVLADQITSPVGYELISAYITQLGTETSTITVKETSSGGTTVATGALSATAATVSITVSNGLLAGGKKLHLANSSWSSNTVRLRAVFRRAV